MGHRLRFDVDEQRLPRLRDLRDGTLQVECLEIPYTADERTQLRDTGAGPLTLDSTILKIFWTLMEWLVEQKMRGAFIARAKRRDCRPENRGQRARLICG